MQLTEIRWHARAGQGAVTAAKLVAETALEQNRYMQAMPEYGPERMGAPIKAFTRISAEPIDIHCNIENPDIVIVLDESLLDVVDVIEGIVEGGTVIINSCEPPEMMRKVLGMVGGNVACVDASGIALDTIKRDIPNTPMIGALAKVTGVVDLEAVKGLLVKTFGKKFGQDIIDANLTSVIRSFEEVNVA
ncbi:MAG: 2-oxoacid:acceptor oxidoreductase family protein [Actinomycetota bacterium]|nr:2-oxoacid:acceptor oxidoreductase family protein [Actinomycetota bacterium]